MAGTYASALAIFGCSALVGQAVFALCGRRDPSLLAPAVGLAALLAVAWAAVRLPGEGTAAAIAVGVVTLAGIEVVHRRTSGVVDALRGMALPVVVAAVVCGSLPFLVEGRFGILGTGLNPDMSQHLFAAETLAAGGAERLISEGYPLGPHALVVAVSELGVSTVHGFNGLMIAVASATCLAALAPAEYVRLALPKRIAAALLVGFAYLLASNYVQGAFKEQIEAMVLLAFAIALAGVIRFWNDPEAGPRALRAVPLAVLAIGAVYSYSFPGLAWLVGALGVWAVAELALAVRRGGVGSATAALRSVAAPAAVAVGVLVVAVAPEIGRMLDFAKFETFDPDGAGLGNLFNRLSPLEALGIWPSGDFRVEPGDGAAPAAAFWLGGAFAAAVLATGVVAWVRRHSLAVPAALAAAAILWLYALVGGTPYQEAKALVLLAPLVAIVSARAVFNGIPLALALAFCVAAGGSSALALANGQVGPSGYTTELAELADELPRDGSTVVTAPADLLDDQHGRDYLVWELRGHRICVEPESGMPPQGDFQAVLQVGLDDGGAVVPLGIYTNESAGAGPGECEFIEDGARADPAGDD
jgi:hypothetical protein